MKRGLWILAVLLAAVCAQAQTPTNVWWTACPGSGPSNNSWGTADYICPAPEPSLHNNLWVVYLIFDNSNTPTLTVSDSAGNTATQDITLTTANVNIIRVYHFTESTAGSTYVKVHFSSSNTGFVGVMLGEYYNVATSSPFDVGHCNRVSSGTVTAGSATPTTNGDLVIQGGFPDDTTASGALTSGGTQGTITWRYAASDRNDSEFVQDGVQGTAAAINAQYTQATSHPTASCFVSYKAASAGTAPTQSYRHLYISHSQMPTGHPNPYVIQIPALGGNQLLIAYTGGGNTISSISTSPANTCTGTGINATMATNAGDIWYCTNATNAFTGNMTLSITMSNTTSDGTFQVHVMTGGNTSSPLDVATTAKTGNQATIVSALTLCSSCLTPSAVGELVLSVMAQDFCTVTAVNAPSGGILDSAIFENNSINGPQPVDQNNLHGHFYTVTTSALTFTSGETCDGTNAEGNWAGGAAAFKAAAGATAVHTSLWVIQP